MDELVHHCLRELSFDGDLGCNVARLRDFVAGFYACQTDSRQLVDDAFSTFVCSVIIQQPSVRVGILPPGSISEVYIAPRTSAKRKAAAKGVELTQDPLPSYLQPIEDARHKPLEDLKREYGDNLRIAVDPETSFVAITGSHIRPPKLSPMVYSALQLITRGREDGITTVELGRKTNYDQKTCFYLIKQLVELGLIIKARRGGVGNHICIHKYFVQRSPLWQQIQEEEARNGDIVATGEHVKPSDVVNRVADPDGSSQIRFDPIDSRHLSSIPLVKNRIVKLLKASRNHTHPSNNLLMTIGFVNPTKTDRRFFRTRLRELIQLGAIERVLVPSSKTRDRTIKCIRLVTSDKRLPEGSIVVGRGVDEDEQEASLAGDASVVHSDVKANLTIHKQVSNMLEDAGPSGLTLHEICASLGNFDKRTIELLLTRASNNRPPAHLSDLGTVDLMETYGRERRHRYFTLASYKCVIANEQLQDTTTTTIDTDLSHVGDFAASDPKLFYATTAKLYSYQDSFKDLTAVKGKKRKRAEGSGGEEDGSLPKRKRGRPRKLPGQMDASSTPPKKRGRPRKKILIRDVEAQGAASQEPSSRQKMGAHAERGEQTIGGVLPAGRAMVFDRVASDALLGVAQSVPSPSTGSFGAADRNEHPESSATSSSSVAHSAGQLADAPLVNVSPKNCDEIAVYQVSEPGDVDISVSRSPRPLESSRQKEGLVTREATPTVVTATLKPIQTAGQELSPTLSHDLGTGEKHKDAIPTPSPRPSKRSRINEGAKSRSNINISALRRENELLKVIETMGGIANMHSKDLFDAHTTLLDIMSQAKEPTSAPVGTRLDKRTAESTLKSLESRGRIKMLKTSLIVPSGISRPACLVYLPDTSQEKVNAFLHQLSQNVPSATMEPLKVLEEPIEYGPSASPTCRAPLPLTLLQIEGQDEKESERLKQLFSYDGKTIRDVLLTERTTVAQLYGFVVGKALRMRQLHLHTLELFHQSSPSPLVISQKDRIIDITYFNQDVTLALHCSLVAVVTHDEDLDLLFASEGKQTLVKNLSSNLHMSLGIGRSRNKSRILELLELLRSLGLVTPLERTKAPGAPFKCSNPDGEIIALQSASLEGWSATTPMLAPLFWHFHASAPVYLWALSDSSPSYWKEHPTNTPTEGEAYWDELRKASRDQAYAQAASCPSTGPPAPAKMYFGLGRCLRRRSSWDPEYFLTWHQKQYLAMKIDMRTGSTLLNIEDMDVQLDQICHVISAPHHVVANYFTVSGGKLKRDLENARRRIRRTRKAEEVQSIEAQSALHKKAEEARTQREQDWEDLLRKIHPEPLKATLAVRLRAVQNRFLQSTTTKDQPRWENEIEKAIKEKQLVSKKIASQLRAKPSIGPVPGPPPLMPNAPEKSIEFLIAQQGPPIPDSVSVKKKGKTKEENEVSRRPRFHWTREFDELARDASAIIRARCRASKLDLSAFDQVFPAVPRNSVRQRITHLRGNITEDVYMKRLEDQWHSLWLQYRGTPHLPDDDPDSPSNFKLMNHIEFLRKHVDKNALRVGFVEHEVQCKLTASTKELHELYEVEEDAASAPTWDFMWSTVVEEGRENQFRSQAFTKEPDGIHEGAKSEKVQLAETVLKMVFGAPNELYDADTATGLLHGVGDQCVSVARSNLLRQGVLSKLVRDPKKAKPGRTLKISDINLNSLGGPFPRDLFQDAISLEDIAIERVVDEMDWPLISSEGDIATLLQLVSEDQVDLTLDLSHSRAARQKIDWNSKRADDEDIETSIRSKFSLALTVVPGENQDRLSESLVELDSHASGQETHEMTLDGKEAACALKTDTGLINCSACIEEAFIAFSSSLDQSDHDLARRILDRVRASREDGLSKAIYLYLGMKAEAEQHVLSLAHRMTLTSPPVLLWICINDPTLVAGDYCGAWGVAVSDGPLTLITPRRWLDLGGYRLDGAWRAAQQAVVGAIFLRPGISQVELRWRLRAVYDRQEIVDLLSSLQEEGILECRTATSIDTVQSLPGWLRTVDKEESVFWFIAKGHHWYQI